MLPLRVKQEFLFSQLKASVVLEVANATRQEKERKGIQVEKKDVEMSLFPVNMSL